MKSTELFIGSIAFIMLAVAIAVLGDFNLSTRVIQIPAFSAILVVSILFGISNFKEQKKSPTNNTKQNIRISLAMAFVAGIAIIGAVFGPDPAH